MDSQEKALLKEKIDKAKVISFDIFDTLLFRKTNRPETIFDLVGKYFGIHGFRRLRMDMQDEASRRAYEAYRYPHADMDQIYEVLGEHTEIPVDWNEVKRYEIQMEQDALTANEELLETFQYAKEQGKRVIATSDMYLFAETLKGILEVKGFVGFDYVYCSADERKAKFNKELFQVVAEKENVAYNDILHIGDKARDDGEFPASLGMDTYVYTRECDLERVRCAGGSDVDQGLFKILCDPNKGFWYNLGVEVGGPLYMGLYLFLMKKLENEKRKIYFLSRDGYNLYHILKQHGYQNIEYLYTSRRALTLAAIDELDEAAIDTLPPYTYGQTVGEILDYLCIDREQIKHLAECGFDTFDDLIQTDQDMAAFKRLYIYDKEVFLERCRVERENAKVYFDSVGLFNQDSICFDCGWQGSSQDLMERFKETAGYTTEQYYIYFGIKNGAKSRYQLRGRRYETFLFDFYKNYNLQQEVEQNVALFELFFSAPHESVYYYGENGEIVFEQGAETREKTDVLDGICDYLSMGLEFVKKYDVEYTPEKAVGHLLRLIHNPTELEAISIGNLANVDGFARKQGEEKYIAYTTKKQLENNPKLQIYWLNGLLKRSDIPEEIKVECALRKGVSYPKQDENYHLEDEKTIRNYHRWLRKQNTVCDTNIEWKYKPYFSVIIPVYNTVTEQLEECIQSVLEQSYDFYELILVDDCSTWENVVPTLQKYESESKVRVIYRSVNGHISMATNDGICMAQGDFIVFMDCDDTIESNALLEFAKRLNQNPELDFLYSDEDKITEDGKIKHMPFFKPDWSPDLFLNMMYTNHLAAYRTSIAKEIGGLRTAYNGSQDYDFTLRFLEKTDASRVEHVAKVLYHWRERKESVAYAMTSKNYAAEAARMAKEDYLRRNKIKACLENIPDVSQYRVVYEVIGNPLVSIIIPSKDRKEFLRLCIDSIEKYTNYKNYEIIVVDNGSEIENRVQIEHYLNSKGIRYVYERNEFNFSQMCNLGAEQARGEYFVFLHDDVEIFQPEWLERLLGQAQQKHVGAVGAKLFYPLTTTIQHSGITISKGEPLWRFNRYEDQYPHYFWLNWVDSDCISVSAACLMVDAKKFHKVQGFNEAIQTVYGDINLCLKLFKYGYYNVIRNDVVAYHYEAQGHGVNQRNREKGICVGGDNQKMLAEFYSLGGRDPFLNENVNQYCDELEMKQYYDDFIEMDLNDCVQTEIGQLETIDVQNRIEIYGWSFLQDEKHIEELERYLVFKDPYGKTYGAKVVPYKRPDVAAYFGNSDYAYAGFECVLKKNDLRVDLMPYQGGILTVGRDGVRYLKWCQEIGAVRQKDMDRIPLEFYVSDYVGGKDVTGEPEQVQWNLEMCVHQQSYHLIRGFAFKRGGDHYLYDKSILLVSKDQKALEFKVHLEERLDVACAYPDEHFLYYTGFECFVLDCMLEEREEYDVVIRLQHRYQSNAVLDIMTGTKINT